MVPRDASETRSPLMPSNRYFINVLFSRDSGMDSALCVIQAPRLSDQCPEGLASQNTISNAGELGVRQSQETRKNPILGTTTSSSPHPPRGAKAGHHKADWLAHISQNLLDTPPCNGCGTEGDAGTDAAFNNPRHPRHLHSSGHHGKAICADSCR